MDKTSLSPAQLVAIAGAVKEAALKTAKAALPENHNETVDFTVRIHGSVQKGIGIAATTSTEPMKLSLETFDVFCAVLNELGVGPKKLATALATAMRSPNIIAADPRLMAVFNEVRSAIEAKLPPITKTVKATAAPVTSQVSAIKVGVTSVNPKQALK
jgi:hypothetical protein